MYSKKNTLHIYTNGIIMILIMYLTYIFISMS